MGAMAGGAFARPDITVIERDGRRFEARYVGLDGITGLSLLELPEKSLSSVPNVDELKISVGQRMRLFSPEPAPETGVSTSNAIYVRIGEAEGQIVSVARGLSGEINRIRIKSLKLSASNIGGIAVNDTGQTIGIVESIEGGEANVLSPAVIRAAAKRVLERQRSVPRPWLGITGEPVAFTSVDRIVRQGWETRRAMSLRENQRGILLNSVAPGSPAAIASLRAGDVIVSVNDNEVQSTDDFSLLLAEAHGNPVHFTVARPDTSTPESVTVKLSESLDPRFPFKIFWPTAGLRALQRNPLIEHGIETVPLRPAASRRPGVSSALLVVFVQPASAAFKSGLRPGDVIEAINGRPIPASSTKIEQLMNASCTLNVARGKAKLAFTVSESQK
jgi:S1-C subfamily serine protease